ncbi:MAG: HAMP domain-containing sensor histidine kinase [Robiginitalea sp.]|uniref:sensor histidine kinase n=1 Tax=Robiginitalea sp. TaxID=1902411 RepID=UPI003C74C470
MARKRIFFITLFVVSIIGLAVIQYRYLKIGLNLARVQFSQKIALVGADVQQDLYGRNQLTFLLANALEKDTSYFKTEPAVLEDATRYFLEDYLRERLIDHQIDREFSFELKARDSSYYLRSAQKPREAEKDFRYPIEVKGYLADRLEKRVVLQLEFQNLDGYFLSQLNGLTLPSLLFLLGILAVVLWVLKTYYWQRKVITTTNAFINNLTHELRTPVFSISLATKILDAKVGEDQREFTGRILKETKKLTNHIDKVLELGALEHKRTVLVRERLDFRPSLEQICIDFNELCELEEQSFTYDLTPGPYLMKASVFHLENAVNNLLDNARKYGSNSPIRLTAIKKGKQLEIRVYNGGMPIPSSALNEIFKKYYRIPDGDRQGVRGYGLGLSYVRTVAEKHRGRVSVSSDPSEGTVFLFVVPLESDGSKDV